MIRSIAFAAIAGALVAVGGFYAFSPSALRYNVAAQAPALDAPANAVTENWPICTTMNAMASEADLAGLDPDFAAAKKALAAEDWNGAIAALKLAALRDPRNADIQNYIGYAYRRLRQLGPAMGHYQQALAFNPRHRSAHAHLGELYLVLREPSGAEDISPRSKRSASSRASRLATSNARLQATKAPSRVRWLAWPAPHYRRPSSQC